MSCRVIAASAHWTFVHRLWHRSRILIYLTQLLFFLTRHSDANSDDESRCRPSETSLFLKFRLDALNFLWLLYPRKCRYGAMTDIRFLPSLAPFSHPWILKLSSQFYNGLYAFFTADYSISRPFSPNLPCFFFLAASKKMAANASFSHNLSRTQWILTIRLCITLLVVTNCAQ